LFTGFLFLVALMSFGMLAVVLNWTVLRPLAKLHTHVARLRDSKDLTAHVEIGSRDELGALGAAFNETTDALRQSQADLEAMHQRLMEMARHAGMADVASGILHNVGNVLNSVNVAAAAIRHEVRDLRVDNLVRATDLLREHIADLGEFLTQDKHGSKLPEYLAGLAQSLKESQESLAGRLVELDRHVQHIAEIVALQQSVAKRIGVNELTNLAEVAEDAIKINDAALIRHGVSIERVFAPTPPLLVDRHQVLQILVNLIGNAKYALRDCERAQKQITVRIEPPDGGRVRISVSDNGAGIAPENLERIFAYGFTTRRDGHGFGLHTAALAATNLSGTLAVHSDGVDKGATFMLELPVREAAGERPNA
jgi:signal transduction histidine kinase